MKNIYLLITFISLQLMGFSSLSQVNYNMYFTSQTMRFDYNIAGDANSQTIYFEQVRKEPVWGGSKVNLLDKFNFGDYRVLIFDSATNNLLYTRGYSDLFKEWQDTEEAKQISRTYYSSVIFPFPKRAIKLQIDRRKRNMKWEMIYTIDINPDSYFINSDAPPSYKTKKIFDSGSPATKVDIVIIPDGYTKKEMRKFHKDSKRFVSYFFECSPFKENIDKFNFWTVDAISEESGTDIPGNDVWKKTVLNTHFYTFDSERYLTTRDVKSIRDIAGCVPYDQIYILVNTDKYGGGGIYNFYNLCSSDNPLSDKVFTHEFGHAFAALADEYAYSDTPASELYDMTVEPFQVNITNLANFDSKWKGLVNDSIPIPTPDSLEYRNIIGAFEGGGYAKKKIYRPTYDCKMRSNRVANFCPVCEQAIIEMINFYCE